jgi:meso-butanediol dehydrogenase/(S,S)-butanediol dehydrogenase/diacetyl reductase
MTSPKRLSGKTAVVTGAGRALGLGAGIVRKLAEEGAAVVISDIGSAKDPSTPGHMVGASAEMIAFCDELTAQGYKVSAKACDVRVRDDVIALADHAVANHGSLDIWVNNAGIGYLMKPILDVSEEDWRAVIDVNLSGAFFGTQAAARIMIAQSRGGRIINIASQAAKSGFIHAQAYCASKHGLVGMIRSAAMELGPHGITINNVCPNHVTTGLGAWQNEYFSKVVGAPSVDAYLKDKAARIPMRRTGLPQDTANAVAFLCTDEAIYITGESMNVSGGEEMH